MIRKFNKNNLSDLLETLKPSLYKKNIILSTNFMRIGIPDFSLNYLIESILEVLGSKYLAIQSYSQFKDRSNRFFSRYNTPVTSVLSNLSKFSYLTFPHLRQLSPTHSFILIGAMEKELNHIFTSAFGTNSSFSYFLEKDFYWLNIGCFLSETCTFMHHVESNFLDYVDYREEVNFDVKIFLDKDENISKLISYQYLSPKGDYLEIDDNWKPVQNHESLLNNQFFINKIPVSFYSLESLMSTGEKILKSQPFIFTTYKKT